MVDGSGGCTAIREVRNLMEGAAANLKVQIQWSGPAAECIKTSMQHTAMFKFA